MRKVLGVKFYISSSSKGFTLIELLVVIAIIGVLSALLMTNFIGIRQRARDGQRKSDIRQIQSALELYRADNGAYPGADSFPSISDPAECGEGVAFTSSGGTTYMKTVPCDPLTNDPYVYDASSSNYCLQSCLENTSDSEVSDVPSSCSSLGIEACAEPYANFIVENP